MQVSQQQSKLDAALREIEQLSTHNSTILDNATGEIKQRTQALSFAGQPLLTDDILASNGVQVENETDEQKRLRIQKQQMDAIAEEENAMRNATSDLIAKALDDDVTFDEKFDNKFDSDSDVDIADNEIEYNFAHSDDMSIDTMMQELEDDLQSSANANALIIDDEHIIENHDTSVDVEYEKRSLDVDELSDSISNKRRFIKSCYIIALIFTILAIATVFFTKLSTQSSIIIFASSAIIAVIAVIVAFVNRMMIDNMEYQYDLNHSLDYTEEGTDD